MSIEEINNEFDVIYENLSSGAAPNLNEYEKSLFLTRAQEELIRMYYNGANVRYSSFESDEEARRYLDTLIRTVNTTLTTPNQLGIFLEYDIVKNDDIMYIVRETVKNASEGCLNGSVMQVTPITHEDLNRVLNNPFKQPNERKVIRYDDTNPNKVVFHIVSKNPLSEYTMVYLKKPNPLIVADLGEFSINNQSEKTTVIEIPELLQRKVVYRAVELAKVTYTGDLTTTFAINARDL